MEIFNVENIVLWGMLFPSIFFIGAFIALISFDSSKPFYSPNNLFTYLKFVVLFAIGIYSTFRINGDLYERKSALRTGNIQCISGKISAYGQYSPNAKQSYFSIDGQRIYLTSSRMRTGGFKQYKPLSRKPKLDIGDEVEACLTDGKLVKLRRVS